jgi:hypothetical protein
VSLFHEEGKMKTVIYKKRGMILKGHFPLLQMTLLLQGYNEEHYWKPLHKKALEESQRRIDNAYLFN